MQNGGVAEAVASRTRRATATAEFPSIVPYGHERTADDASPALATSCPEIACIRDRLSDGVIAVAERRAAELGVGADRVLIASGAIAEEDYVRALAAYCDVAFDPLDITPRSAVPLTDDRLLEAAAVGLLPLNIAGSLVIVVAPRGTTARRLAGIFTTGSGIR